MMSYQVRRAKFLYKMLKTESPGIICVNKVRIAIISLHKWKVGVGIYFVGFSQFCTGHSLRKEVPTFGTGGPGLHIPRSAWGKFRG